MIQMRGIRKVYSTGRVEVEALRGVDLEIQRNEYVAVVGPSGSGKSTLFRLMLGFESPEFGKVAYDGQNLATLDLPAVRPGRLAERVTAAGATEPVRALRTYLRGATITDIADGVRLDIRLATLDIARLADEIRTLANEWPFLSFRMLTEPPDWQPYWRMPGKTSWKSAEPDVHGARPKATAPTRCKPPAPPWPANIRPTLGPPACGRRYAMSWSPGRPSW